MSTWSKAPQIGIQDAVEATCQLTGSEQSVEPGKACGISGFDYRGRTRTHTNTHIQ